MWKDTKEMAVVLIATEILENIMTVQSYQVSAAPRQTVPDLGNLTDCFAQVVGQSIFANKNNLSSSNFLCTCKVCECASCISILVDLQ